MSTFVNDPNYMLEPRWPEWCRFVRINCRYAKLIEVSATHVKFEAPLIGDPKFILVDYESLTTLNE